VIYFSNITWNKFSDVFPICCLIDLFGDKDIVEGSSRFVYGDSFFKGEVLLFGGD